jgi:hypothetical protein
LDFVLINRAGKGIATIELAPTGTANWQADQPDPDGQRKPVAENGGRLTVRFDKGPGCNYDLKATFADGTGAVWTHIDLCGNAYVTVSVSAAGTPTFHAN